MNRIEQLCLAFGVGAACGVIAALVTAPSSGAKTRRRLRGWGEVTARRARHGVESIRRMAADQAHRLGHALEEAREAYPREVSEPRDRVAGVSGDHRGA